MDKNNALKLHALARLLRIAALPILHFPDSK